MRRQSGQLARILERANADLRKQKPCYSSALADTICGRLADGQSLRSICADNTMPHRATVLRWLDANPDFRDQYARAREAQADHFADEILQIADDASADYTTKEGSDGQPYEAVDHEHINRSRLRVDTRKWLAARMAPKKYGDRVVSEHVGKDGSPSAVVILPDNGRGDASYAKVRLAELIAGATAAYAANGDGSMEKKQ